MTEEASRTPTLSRTSRMIALFISLIIGGRKRGRQRAVCYETPLACLAGRRRTTESNHHHTHPMNTSPPEMRSMAPHRGHLCGSPKSIRGKTGPRIRVVCITLRPRSKLNTEWHFGQCHLDHHQGLSPTSCHRLNAWPQLGHFLLPTLYKGGLNHAMSASTPGGCQLYHVGYSCSTSATT